MSAALELPPTKQGPTSDDPPSAALNVLPGQRESITHLFPAGEAQTTHPTSEPPMPNVLASGGSPVPPLTEVEPAPVAVTSAEGTTQRVGQGQATPDAHTTFALADPLLYLAAVSLDDLERVRIAAENRLRQLTRDTKDADGEERGFGLTADNAQVRAQQSIVDGLSAMEHRAELAMKRQLRAHPLHGWIKGTIGVGEKQAARLLAAIGDPYWNTLLDRPRTVSELWSYCGYRVVPGVRTPTDARPNCDAGHINIPADPGHASTQGTCVGGEQSGGDPGREPPAPHLVRAGVAVRRKKGQRANWSSVAKMRAYLIAESCIKQARSPYRGLYEKRRAHTAVTRPDWTAGHSHNDALRVVAKEVLKDLWRAARDVHAEEAS